MTLLEVIVALTVAGSALAAGAGVLGFLTDQQARNSTETLVSAHSARSALHDWISAARLATEGDAEFRGLPASRMMNRSLVGSSERTSDEITFITGAPTAIAPAGTQVHIFMRHAGADSSQAAGLVAELTPWRTAGRAVTISLAPDASGFQARYLGSIFGARAWQPSWISTSVLPVAVELRVSFDSATASPDRAAHAILSIPMTIPLGGRR